MATTNINPVEESQKGRSALDNFATAMGILGTVGNLGMQGYNMANPQESAFDKWLKMQTMNAGNNAAPGQLGG